MRHCSLRQWIHRQRFFTVLLVLCVLFAGLSRGLMAEQGPDGFRVVICTGHGTIEQWMPLPDMPSPAAEDASLWCQLAASVQPVLGVSGRALSVVARLPDTVPVPAVVNPPVVGRHPHPGHRGRAPPLA